MEPILLEFLTDIRFSPNTLKKYPDIVKKINDKIKAKRNSLQVANNGNEISWNMDMSPSQLVDILRSRFGYTDADIEKIPYKGRRRKETIDRLNEEEAKRLSLLSQSGSLPARSS